MKMKRHEINFIPGLDDFKRFFKLDDSCESGLRWKRRFPFFIIKDGKTIQYFKNLRGYNTAHVLASGRMAGTIGYTGTEVSNKKYWIVVFLGHTYKCHRIIYMLQNNINLSKDQEIDHEDGDGLNNEIGNLRMASRSQNTFNTKLCVTNTSGVKGVRAYHLPDGRKRYRTRVNIMGKQRSFGSYDTIEEAAKAVKSGRRKLHGEFTRHE